MGVTRSFRILPGVSTRIPFPVFGDTTTNTLIHPLIARQRPTNIQVVHIAKIIGSLVIASVFIMPNYLSPHSKPGATKLTKSALELNTPGGRGRSGDKVKSNLALNIASQALAKAALTQSSSASSTTFDSTPVAKSYTSSTHLESRRPPTTRSSYASQINLTNECQGNVRFAWSYENPGKEAVCVSVLENELVGVGISDGSVSVYHLSTGQLVHELRPSKWMDGLKVPPTTLAWRPHWNHVTGILVAGYPDGQVVGWHAHGSGEQVWQLPVVNNQIFAIDFSSLDTFVATAGSDTQIRVYDESASLIHCLKTVKDRGHSNRIYCLRFHPKLKHILISAGWDSTIQVWDLDLGYSVRSIFQPHVIGDCLDFNESGTLILAGSYTKSSDGKPRTCLDLYCVETGMCVESIPWSDAGGACCKLYSTRFSPSRKFVVAAGGNPVTTEAVKTLNQVKVFNFATRQCVAYVSGLPGAVYCAKLSLDDRHLVLGGAFGSIYCYTLDPHCPQEVIH